MEDAPNASAAITDALAAGLALELVRAGLLGSGAGSEPTGIFIAAGVQSISMGTNGAALINFSQLSQAVQKVGDANSTPAAAIYAPRTAGVLDRLADTTGQPIVPPPAACGTISVTDLFGYVSACTRSQIRIMTMKTATTKRAQEVKFIFG